MGIVPAFDIRSIEAELDRKRAELHVKIVRYLNRAGMEIVNWAKDNRGYIDQTGNLNNSIGYAVIKDNAILNMFFEAKSRERKAEGKEKGESYTRELAKDISGGKYALIIVAGMEYASFVEDVYGKNVITHSKGFAREVLEKMLKIMKNEK